MGLIDLRACASKQVLADALAVTDEHVNATAIVTQNGCITDRLRSEGMCTVRAQADEVPREEKFADVTPAIAEKPAASDRPCHYLVIAVRWIALIKQCFVAPERDDTSYSVEQGEPLICREPARRGRSVWGELGSDVHSTRSG